MSQHAEKPVAGDANLPADSAEWLELAKWLQDRLHHRQAYEWKIALGFWAVLVATCLKDVSFSAASISTGWWALAWLAFVFVWVRGLWVANENDKNRVRELFEHATGVKTGPYNDPKRISMSDSRFWFGFCHTWSAQFQAAATLGIMLAISKGQRDLFHFPASLREFWWGESLALTWVAVLAVGGILWVLAWWLLAGMARGRRSLAGKSGSGE